MSRLGTGVARVRLWVGGYLQGLIARGKMGDLLGFQTYTY